jgi:AraC-like DNA-binding protein/ligand-binding sensor protein
MPEEVSLLEQFIAIIQRESGLHLSFDDLTGINTGFHNDIPKMRLHWEYQSHTCGMCKLAKRGVQGNADCIRNKILVNRLALRRRSVFHGICHLGLFEIIEPLIYRGTVLGVFFFGSVLLRERAAESQDRIRRYCKRRKLSPAPYLRQLAQLPVISTKDIPQYRATLHSVVELAHFLCESSGIQPELYKRKRLSYANPDPQNAPYVIQETLRYVMLHLHEPFIIKDIANQLKCHPDFLSRRFKEFTGHNLSAYLQELRVNRARAFLQNPKISIDEVASQSGFTDRSYFSKVFRRVTKQTPGDYRRQALGGQM